MRAHFQLSQGAASFTISSPWRCLREEGASKETSRASEKSDLCLLGFEVCRTALPERIGDLGSPRPVAFRLLSGTPGFQRGIQGKEERGSGSDSWSETCFNLSHTHIYIHICNIGHTFGLGVRYYLGRKDFAAHSSTHLAEEHETLRPYGQRLLSNTDSLTSTACPTVQFHSDANYQNLRQTPNVRMLSPTRPSSLQTPAVNTRSPPHFFLATWALHLGFPMIPLQV